MTASQVVNLRIPPVEVAEIDRLAAAAGITRAAWMLAAIRQRLSGETGTTPAESETRLAAVEAQLAELAERMPAIARQAVASQASQASSRQPAMNNGTEQARKIQEIMSTEGFLGPQFKLTKEIDTRCEKYQATAGTQLAAEVLGSAGLYVAAQFNNKEIAAAIIYEALSLPAARAGEQDGRLADE